MEVPTGHVTGLNARPWHLDVTWWALGNCGGREAAVKERNAVVKFGF